MIPGLTNKEIVELRIKTLEPIVMSASKNGLEKGEVFNIAEQAWAYAVKPLVDDKKQIPQTPGTGSESRQP